MKRYRVEYFQGGRSKPRYLTELSKSEKWDGVRISFLTTNGRKYYQLKFKNNLWNGLYKHWWWNNRKNRHFTNWKKDKVQGIKIDFK